MIRVFQSTVFCAQEFNLIDAVRISLLENFDLISQWRTFFLKRDKTLGSGCSIQDECCEGFLSSDVPSSGASAEAVCETIDRLRLFGGLMASLKSV
ncbi:uncharacterized protein LAJ45_04008 [Morchella importuna]|uniref:uncharacterized protein n=1 Tax=Morchella importuna TaxID=1174673 RepID=UPI001E8D5551|nr:uncharacterized protein LAJ45_04008 [Morchella importuna]KAH8152015.1 hypothetical protein LAJ45_04008 [Morchella importuna]